MLTIRLKVWAISPVASSLPILTGISYFSLSISKTSLTVIINKQVPHKPRQPGYTFIVPLMVT